MEWLNEGERFAQGLKKHLDNGTPLDGENKDKLDRILKIIEKHREIDRENQ